MKRWQWALGVVAILGILGAVYFKSIVFFLFEETYPLFFESDLITRLEPEWGVGLRPNLRHAKVVAPARPHRVQHIKDRTHKSEVTRRAVFYVDTNEYAFRGESFDKERSPGDFRMFCVGDSITFGWGVAEEDSYCGQLRAMLRAAHPNRRIDVINAGIPGYPIGNIPALITHKLAPFKPDLIFAIKLGDLQSPDPLKSFDTHVRKIVHAARSIGADLIMATPPISSFDLKPQSWQFGPRLKRLGRELGIPTIDFAPIFREKGQGRGLKLEVKDGIQYLVRYRKGKREVILKTSPDRDQSSVALPVYRWLDKTTETEALFFDDGHPDKEGNRIIAEVIFNLIEDGGYLQKSARRAGR